MPLLKKAPAPIEPDMTVVSPALAKVLAEPVKAAPVAKVAHTKEDYWSNREIRDIETGIRIRRSGVWQAAAQSQALMQYAPSIEEYFVLVNRMAEEGLKWVNKD